MNLLHPLSNNYIHAGDFNAKNTIWNSRITNPRGKQLEAHADLNKYNIIAPLEPTHFPYNNSHLPDILDIALINTTLTPLHIESISALTPDHNPVLIIFDHNPASNTFKESKFNKINWSDFRNYLNESAPGNIEINSEKELKFDFEFEWSRECHAPSSLAIWGL